MADHWNYQSLIYNPSPNYSSIHNNHDQQHRAQQRGRASNDSFYGVSPSQHIILPPQTSNAAHHSYFYQQPSNLSPSGYLSYHHSMRYTSNAPNTYKMINNVNNYKHMNQGHNKQRQDHPISNHIHQQQVTNGHEMKDNVQQKQTDSSLSKPPTRRNSKQKQSNREINGPSKAINRKRWQNESRTYLDSVESKHHYVVISFIRQISILLDEHTIIPLDIIQICKQFSLSDLKISSLHILESGLCHEFDTIIIHEYGTLTTTHWNGKQGGKLLIKSRYIKIESNGKIEVNGKGYGEGEKDGGGNDGGIIHIICDKLMNKINGYIQSKGEIGYGSGCEGSGGSIYIKSKEIINNGTIEALGGRGGGHGVFKGGDGGFGRIRIDSSNFQNQGSIQPPIGYSKPY